MFRKIAQPVFTAYAMVLFVACFFITCPFNILFSLAGNTTGRKWVNKTTRLFFESWLLLTGMPVISKGAVTDGRFVYVSNHKSYIDDLIIFSAIRSHFRPLGKKEMAKVPLWGYLYKHIVVLVDRKSAESRARSMDEMAQVLRNECGILIFPEGTFNETNKPLKDFYDGAFRLAISTQTPIVPIIFPDAGYRAPCAAWWKIWPGRNRCIFLPQVPVAGLETEDIARLKQEVYEKMEHALIQQQRDYKARADR